MSLFRKTAPSRSVSRDKLPDTAPPTAHADEIKGVYAWYERFARPLVERNRYFSIIVLLLFVIIIQSISLSEMIPLKRAFPVIVTVNQNTGRPDATALKAEDYKPNDLVKKYFLGRFVTLLMTTDPDTTTTNLKEAGWMVVDKATTELDGFLQDQKPFVMLANDPTYTRASEINTVTILPQGNTALVRVYTNVLKSGETSPAKMSWIFTIHFKEVPPDAEDTIYKNPLGLYVTDFTYQQEAVQGGSSQ